MGGTPATRGSPRFRAPHLSRPHLPPRRSPHSAPHPPPRQPPHPAPHFPPHGPSTFLPTSIHLGDGNPRDRRVLADLGACAVPRRGGPPLRANPPRTTPAHRWAAPARKNPLFPPPI